MWIICEVPVNRKQSRSIPTSRHSKNPGVREILAGIGAYKRQYIGIMLAGHKQIKTYVDTDACLGLTPIAEQHPTHQDLRTFRYVLQVVYPCVCNRELSGRRAEDILDWHRLFDVPACKI